MPCTLLSYRNFIMMFEGKRPAAISIIKPSKVDASPSAQSDHSPSITNRRRRNKLEKTCTKTNEDLIQQSHEMLMQYIEGLDTQVKHLLDNHEAQFLVAYRKHSAKVKEEMKEIKHQMLENTQNERVYVERIRFLERELVIFREETLKMSEKLIAKNEQIDSLKGRLNEVVLENDRQRETIANLTKSTMTLSARLQKHQHPFATIPLDTTQSKLPSQIGVQSPQSQLKSMTAQMRTRPIRNRQKITISNLISSTIQENPVQAGRKEQTCQKPTSDRTDLSNRKQSSSVKARFQRSRLLQSEIYKLKSKTFAERNQYQRIFIQCVEEVRSNLMRKQYADSLNYFKQNGPRNLIQFKKMDYFTLLDLFLRKDMIARKFYELLFDKAPS